MRREIEIRSVWCSFCQKLIALAVKGVGKGNIVRCPMCNTPAPIIDTISTPWSTAKVLDMDGAESDYCEEPQQSLSSGVFL